MSGTNQPIPFNSWEDIETLIQGLSGTQLDTLKPGRDTSGDKYLLRPRDAFFTKNKDAVIGRILQHKVNLAGKKYRVIMILELYSNQKFYLLKSTKGPPNFCGWTGNGWTTNTWVYGEKFEPPEKDAIRGDAEMQIAQAHILQHRPNDHNKNSWIESYHPRGATTSNAPAATTVPTNSTSQNNTSVNAATSSKTRTKAKSPKPRPNKSTANKNDSAKPADGRGGIQQKPPKLRLTSSTTSPGVQKKKSNAKTQPKHRNGSIAPTTIPVVTITPTAISSSNATPALNLPPTLIPNKKRRRDIEFEQELTDVEAKRQCQAFLRGWCRGDLLEPTQILVGLAYTEWNTPIWQAQTTNPHHLRPWIPNMGGPADIQHELPTDGIKHVYRYATSQRDAVYTTAPVSRSENIKCPMYKRGIQDGSGFYDSNAAQKTKKVKEQREGLRAQAELTAVVPRKLKDMEEVAAASVATREAFYNEQKAADELEALLPDISD